MRTSADLLLTQPSIPAAPRALRRLMTVVLNLPFDAAEGVRQAVRARPRQPAWREDLPWGVGTDRLVEQAMDHLAKQAFPPWIPRC